MPEARVLEALDRLGEVASLLVVAYRSLQDAVAGGDSDQVSPAEVPRAAAGLLAGASRTVLAVTGLPDALGLLPSSTILAGIAAGGAGVRVLGQDKLRADRAGGQLLSALARSGAQVATAPVIPPAIVIVDSRVALMAANEPYEGNAGSAFLLRDPEIAGYLASAIHSLWAMAMPLRDLSETTGEGLSPVDQALLRLLAEGKTQHEVARSLNLSVRTISRRIADLKQELKADSPLQAGMEAVRRGWL
jgi:DNA-binding CsgD family transcriptional regulator